MSWKDIKSKDIDISPLIPVHGAQQCLELLQSGPLEFFLGAEVSPSLRALRFTCDDAQLSSVDLALAVYHKFVLCNAAAHENPKDILLSLVNSVSPNSSQFAETHSLLGVYFADEGDFEQSVYHYQQAANTYLAQERNDGLLVCLVRHSISMSENGRDGPAAVSLMQAMSLAPTVDRLIYTQYCQLAHLHGLYYRSQLIQAGHGAAELRTESCLGPVFSFQLLAMQYAGLVEQKDFHNAVKLWDEIVESNLYRLERCNIATHARIRFLLQTESFSEASEVALVYLRSAKFVSDNLRHTVIRELTDSPEVSDLPESLGLMFQSLMRSFEIASHQNERIDLNLDLKSFDETV